MKYDVQVTIKYVPLPVEQEPMWEEAMQILIRWLKEIDLDTFEEVELSEAAKELVATTP